MNMKSAAMNEQPIILEKPAILSRLFLWVIMLITSSSIIWAYFAEIDQAVPATGQLELKDGSIDVQAPTSGNVVRLHVENGDRVEKNQPLLTFSPTVPSTDLASSQELRESLKKENIFYGDVIDGKVPTELPPDLQTLAKDRQSRVVETQVFQALIDELYLGRGGYADIDSSQQGLYQNSRAEYGSRVGAVELQVQELEKQLQQAQKEEEAAKEQLRVAQDQLQYAKQQLEYGKQQLSNSDRQLIYAYEQLNNTKKQLDYAKEQLNNTKKQLDYAKEQLNNSQAQLQYSKEQLELAKGQLNKSEKVLGSNQEILDQISPLVEEGAIAELQKKRQEQEVFRGESELLRQQDQIQSRAGEINSRMGEINSRLSDINTREGEVNSGFADINTLEGQVNSRLADINTLEGEINTRKAEINSREADINARAGEIKAREAEVERAKSEQQRLTVSVNRAQEQLKNTKEAWAKELYTRIAENKKEIARIDSQFARLELENKKRLTEVNGQIEKLQESRDNQVLRAPVSGLIFELKPTTKEESSLDIKTDPICQYVINEVLKPNDIKPEKCEEASYEAQQTEPLLKVLDDDEGLEGVVYIQNKDIALVLKALNDKRKKLEPYHDQELAGGEVVECEPGKKCVCPELKENREKLGLKDVECVPVEVQVEALPANEFGTVTGEVVSISDDAIPPDQQAGRPYFSFKTKIELERQTFLLDNESDLELSLQNGMAINSNINVGKRTVLELFFNRFTGKFKSLTNVN